MNKHNGPYAKPPSERFWSKVCKSGPDDCWEWIGARNPDGYGFMLYRKKNQFVRAHRLSWEIYNGPVPDGLSVLHHCDNPACVNPAHLYVGTQAQNCRDRALRRRGKEHHQNGIANDNAKLTEADVIAIDAMLKAGISQSETARVFGVGQAQVWRIKERRAWRHLWEE